MQDLLERIIEFRDLRDWEQFHTARTLAASIVVEAAELVEIFQWSKDTELNDLVEEKYEQISNEFADIMIYLLLFADHVGIDIDSSVKHKLEINNQRYPVAKAKGNAYKHSDILK